MKFFNWHINNRASYKRNAKSIFVAVTLVLVSSLGACSSIERMRSESLFEQYCHEEGRVGQFIYERVALGEEFFRSIPTDIRELDRIENSFYIDNKKLLIDKESFMKSYTINYLKRIEVSSVGPIYSVESTLVRKSDGKVLSKAVSLLNKRGKTSKIFPVQGVTCPTGRDSKGHPFYNMHHFNLIENTFFKQ
jgi:hypothetical protein